MAGQAPSELEASTRNMLAIGYIKQGQGSKAVAHIKEALAYYRQEAPETPMMGTLYNNLGTAYKVMGQWTESLKWLCRAVDWAIEPGQDDTVLAYTHGHLSEILHQLGANDTAAYRGEQSLAICLETQNESRARETLAVLQKVYQATGNQQRAARLMEIQEQWPKKEERD